MVPIFVYFAVGVLTLLYLFRRNPKPKNFPPGPRGFPVLGHLPLLGGNGKKTNKTFSKWANKYGPIFSLEWGSFPVVVINDAKLIKTAFNDLDYSGRPDFPMFKAKSGGVVEGVILTHGQKWHEQRRFILRTLRDFGFGKKSMEVIVHDEIKDLIETIQKMNGKPLAYPHNMFNAAVLNALWTIIAGQRFKQDDPELQIAIKHLASSSAQLNIRAMIANFFPILVKYAPELSGFNKSIADFFPILDFLKKPVEAHKSSFQAGQPRDFIDVYLEEIEKTEDPNSSFYKAQGDKSLLYSVLDLFAAGAETTSTTLQYTLLYLAKYPQYQKRLQAEIQAVIGDSRLPSLNDRPNMPYTEAVIHEVLRFSTLVPMGLRSTLTEVQLGGYTIPKNTIILGNNYAGHFDEKIWGDPETFRPDRFLNKNGEFVKHEGFVAFSVGKRACIGEVLARDELFLFTTSLFQVFSVAPVGSPDELPIEGIAGPVQMPQPHQVIFREIN